jgi:hypothetical protein
VSREWPLLGTMCDALKAVRRSSLAELLEESRTWPDRGRAYRSRLVGRIAHDWDRLVANPLPNPDPPAHGGTDVRTRNCTRKGPAPMKVASLYPSKYLRADDLDGEDVLLTIKSIEICHDFDQPKPVVTFAEGDAKGLVLNKTNTRAIAASLGPETDDWIGQRIVLFVAQVPMEGRGIVDAIRVRVPKRKAAAAKKAPGAPLVDDEIAL